MLIQCTTDIQYDTVSITLDSTILRPSQHYYQDGLYIDTVVATIDQLGRPRDAQCNWTAEGLQFIKQQELTGR